MVALVGLLWAMQTAFGQRVTISTSAQIQVPVSNIIVPQTRVFVPPAGTPAGVEVTGVKVEFEILEQVAVTTMEVSLTNSGSGRLEAQMVIPVPDRAALRGFTFQGSGSEPKAELLTKEEARRIYDEIVSKAKDPALLEFLGYNLVKSSVFPVEPRSGQKVRLVYEHLLGREGDRVDYVLPRTESIDYRVPWRITGVIKAKAGVSTVYSPSHEIDTRREGESVVRVRMGAEASTEPGPFRLSCLMKRGGLTASLLAYPDAKIGGGYFLLLAGAPERPAGAEPMKREVILVLDRSGSMAGEKLEQVRQAALQVIEGLEDGEAFNLIVYNESVELFAPEPVIKSAETIAVARKYIRSLRVRGGTNIHDAMQEALRMRATKGYLPLVLFLTDGLPTVGQTSEKAIREMAEKGNPHRRRVFTFGVGVDVNTPLLDRIAVQTRAAATYVLPKEDVEVKVGQVFKRLAGPVLADVKLQAQDANGKPTLTRVREVMPGQMPDMFEEDQVIVFGQYVGEEPLNFELRGQYAGQERTFRFHFDLDKASTKNAFVSRLWASRKIAVLTDAIRDLGAENAFAANPAPNDPRMKELVEEIVKLSKEFGILSEYTAFLALEGMNLAQEGEVYNHAFGNFDTKALKTRSGLGAVNQSMNVEKQRKQSSLNNRNAFYDENLNKVEVSTVQQVSNRAYYKKGNRWVESGLVDRTNAAPARVVEMGSKEFRVIVEKLARENRQGAVTLKGEILLEVEGENILVR